MALDRQLVSLRKGNLGVVHEPRGPGRDLPCWHLASKASRSGLCGWKCPVCCALLGTPSGPTQSHPGTNRRPQRATKMSTL